jgi:hypothetical protein
MSVDNRKGKRFSSTKSPAHVPDMRWRLPLKIIKEVTETNTCGNRNPSHSDIQIKALYPGPDIFQGGR